MQNTDPGDQLLEITHLNVVFNTYDRVVNAVKDVSFNLHRGEILGIVGESGSGKSVTSLAILNLLKDNKKALTSGSVKFCADEQKVDLLTIANHHIESIRGRRISMVFQEPMSSLNPVKRCGQQISEVFEIHKMYPVEQREKRIYDLLASVQLEDTERIYRSYPHELSGGQLQRVNIAMALAGEPDILLCDEPTTALDVTVQKEIISLLKNVVQKRQIAMIFVCHDLDVVAELCDSVIVMYRGAIVESGKLPDVFKNPKHLYTQALLRCKPKMEHYDLVLPTVSKILSGHYQDKKRKPKQALQASNTILQVQNLTVRYLTNPFSFFSRKKYNEAVSDVSFEVKKGEVFGIVGESGSGKSTIANCISGILSHSTGKIVFDGREITVESLQHNPQLRRSIQLVFQDPYSSLNPRMSIGECISEPIKHHHIGEKNQWRFRAVEMLERVGLGEEYYDRYPHELSGGQRQRVCIARALSVEPQLLICDECVSALDVSVQAQILNLLDELKHSLGLTMLFISHDLSVVHYISDHIMVMNKGNMVEYGPAHEVITAPRSAYTHRLVESIPASI